MVEATRVRGLLALLAVATLTLAGATTAARLPQAPACQVFPASNPWNQRVDKLPVAESSNGIVASIGVDDHVHADFGSRLWEGSKMGIPITVVSEKTPRTRVSSSTRPRATAGVPIPSNVKIEGGSDHHAILVDKSSCKLYELFALERRGGRWHAGSGAIWNLSSNKLRPRGWTSADAAGLPISPASRVTTRSRAGGSTTRSGSRSRRRARLRVAGAAPEWRSPACRRWGCACG